MRRLVLDDGLPAELAAELERRGRPATTIAALGLREATDAEAVRVDGVLVTTDRATAATRGGTVALVPPGVAGRDAVHRHAHELAAQRPGSSRTYR